MRLSRSHEAPADTHVPACALAGCWQRRPAKGTYVRDISTGPANAGPVPRPTSPATTDDFTRHVDPDQQGPMSGRQAPQCGERALDGELSTPEPMEAGSAACRAWRGHPPILPDRCGGRRWRMSLGRSAGRRRHSATPVAGSAVHGRAEGPACVDEANRFQGALPLNQVRLRDDAQVVEAGGALGRHPVVRSE
jgi:hypothetical protein